MKELKKEDVKIFSLCNYPHFTFVLVTIWTNPEVHLLKPKEIYGANLKIAKLYNKRGYYFL
jgi:hypothetical protein